MNMVEDVRQTNVKRMNKNPKKITGRYAAM
jgi:hypothetical protein